jgi:hypothetical protein
LVSEEARYDLNTWNHIIFFLLLQIKKNKIESVKRFMLQACFSNSSSSSQTLQGIFGLWRS